MHCVTARGIDVCAKTCSTSVGELARTVAEVLQGGDGDWLGCVHAADIRVRACGMRAHARHRRRKPPHDHAGAAQSEYPQNIAGKPRHIAGLPTLDDKHKRRRVIFRENQSRKIRVAGHQHPLFTARPCHRIRHFYGHRNDASTTAMPAADNAAAS